MKYIGISGGWRKTTPEIEKKIRKTIREIFARGDGICSGGALGVDFTALDEALKFDPKAKRIKIFLPTTLKKYSQHYRKHAQLGTITSKQAEELIAQLTHLKKINSKSLIENPDENFIEKTKKKMYYERNTKVIEASDELVAFHIKTHESDGLGTADTIKKAKQKRIPVRVFEFNIK